MTADARTVAFDPGAVVVLRRTSRLLAKAALVVEEDADRWAVYVATGAASGSDFWRAAVETSERKASKLARDMMDGRAWPKGDARTTRREGDCPHGGFFRGETCTCGAVVGAGMICGTDAAGNTVNVPDPDWTGDPAAVAARLCAPGASGASEAQGAASGPQSGAETSERISAGIGATERDAQELSVPIGSPSSNPDFPEDGSPL